jgi:hypothetical protein
MMVFDRNVAIIESIQDRTGESRVWKSQVSIYSSKEQKIVARIAMDEDEACLSMCFSRTKEGEVSTDFLLLGCVKNMRYYPNFAIKTPKIKTYEWDAEKS